MEATDVTKDHSLRFLETFLYAGTSVLLVAAPRLHPDFSFISLFALVPFLWRAIHVNAIESLVLGASFGTMFYFVTAQFSQAGIPTIVFPYLTAVIVLLSLYGLAVNRIAKHIGINAIFLAVVWLPVEYVLGICTHLRGIFVFSDLDSPIVVRMNSLFGVLIVSFLIVLINTLILLISDRLARCSWSRASHRAEDPEQVLAICKTNSIFEYPYCIPAVRPPPC